MSECYELNSHDLLCLICFCPHRLYRNGHMFSKLIYWRIFFERSLSTSDAHRHENSKDFFFLIFFSLHSESSRLRRCWWWGRRQSSKAVNAPFSFQLRKDIFKDFVEGNFICRKSRKFQSFHSVFCHLNTNEINGNILVLARKFQIKHSSKSLKSWSDNLKEGLQAK